jgi:hypothetical protein
MRDAISFMEAMRAAHGMKSVAKHSGLQALTFACPRPPCTYTCWLLFAGNLTMKLLERAKKVIAIELDPRMVSCTAAAAAAAATAVATGSSNW